MSAIYHRPKLAEEMTRQLLRPGILDQGLRSGLFLSGLRRTGKTTFLRHDLIPALENAGAVVIYVDLWSDTTADPSTLIHAALRSTLQQLKTPTSSLLERLRAIKGLDLGVAGFSFGFELESLGAPAGPSIARALIEVIDQAGSDVVFIVDEVQHMLTSETGLSLMQGLKAARDAVNARPGTPGHFIFIGTGSHRAQVVGMTVQGRNAFEGATSVEYPVLGEDFVGHVIEGLRREGVSVIPSLQQAFEAFAILGRRPEELLRALNTLQLYKPQEADQYLPVIAATLKRVAADLELRKIDDLGSLAGAVFNRIAQSIEDASGLFSAAALADYASGVGRDVSADQVQRIAQQLQDFNLIVRKGYGRYAVTDPFVQEAWREHRAALDPIGREAGIRT